MARSSLRPHSRQPSTPIEHLVASLREYLHLPDPSAVYVLMGAVAANLVDGYPVWLMLVGAPGAGKTELVNSLLNVPLIHEMANISGEGSFLSGTATKERSSDATGGVLNSIGTHGGIILNDFTSVLSLPQDTLKKVLAVFRECYSGRWTRNVGSDGGRTLKWEGKVMFIAGCTGSIDNHHMVNASLGERWVYYRFDRPDGFAQSKRALTNAASPGWADNVRALVHGFFESIDLRFGASQPRRLLTDSEMVRVITMAAVAARCRSAVTRDNFSKSRDIMAVPEPEVESRIATSLGQLLIGMDYIGVPEADRWRLLGKVALDSMPRLRRIIVNLAAHNGGVGFKQLQLETGCSKTVVARSVEELEVFGVVDRQRSGQLADAILPDDARVMVQLSSWMRGEVKKGWRGDEGAFL